MSFDMGERAYHLAVSGDIFRWMVDYGSHETLQRVSENTRGYHGNPSNFSETALGAVRHLCTDVSG
jgi:hypothetical protein